MHVSCILSLDVDVDFLVVGNWSVANSEFFKGPFSNNDIRCQVSSVENLVSRYCSTPANGSHVEGQDNSSLIGKLAFSEESILQVSSPSTLVRIADLQLFQVQLRNSIRPNELQINFF